MKICKRFVIGLVLLQVAISSSAQIQFQYGPRVGLGFSSFAGKDAHNTNIPVGTIVGIYTNTQFTKTLSLNAELNYISCGSIFTVQTNTPEEMQLKSALGYMGIPVNADVAVFKNIHLQAGMQVAFILSALTEAKYQGIITKKTTIEGYHSVDWGPTVGCFYQFNWGLQAGVRYYRGLQSVFKNDAKIYNTYIQFLITYRFSKVAH